MSYLYIFYFHTAYIPAKNMVFSDVTSDSFKVSWSPAGSEVLSYLIKYKVAVGGDEFIVSVPASSTSSVLTNLLPETTYAVSVISEYEDGDGPALDGEETTLEGRLPLFSDTKKPCVQIRICFIEGTGLCGTAI